ncbi:hypothetical protein F5Y19DRAFT_477254 [Xylariaceae sp. FL1651]|nr:hypothetical protein F5Y19DRAFT_477254 [Xylariaceae sp. FL1651]
MLSGTTGMVRSELPVDSLISNSAYTKSSFEGNVDYTWENSTQTASNDQSVPRTEPSIDQLAGGFSNLNVNSGAYSHDQGIAYSSQDALPIDNSASGLPASPLYTHDTQHYHHRDKGKAVASAASHDHHYGEGHSHTSTVSSSDPYNTHGYPEHQLEGTASSFSGIGSGHASNDSYPEPSDHGEDDYELHQALKLSREELYGGSRSGGPSGSSAHYHTGYINPDTYAPNPDDFPEGETTPRGTPAPRGRPSHSGSSGVPPNFTISGTPGDAEQFDQQPKGQVAGDESISDLKDIGGPTSPFYVGYRRFIIVSTDESHHSTCV